MIQSIQQFIGRPLGGWNSILTTRVGFPVEQSAHFFQKFVAFDRLGQAVQICGGEGYFLRLFGLCYCGGARKNNAGEATVKQFKSSNSNSIVEAKMGENNTGSEAKPMANKPAKSGGLGTMGRLGVLLVIFLVAAGGIIGYQYYLESLVPKGDENFVREKAPNVESEEEKEESGLEILAGMFKEKGPSKEMLALQELSADEVEYTYDDIMAMSAAELKKNIDDLSQRLEEMRADLPPSFGGASAGGGPPPSGGNENDPPKKEVTIQSLALPLEVMRQVAEGK